MSYFWRLLFSIIILLVLSFSTLFQSTFASTEVMQNQRLEGYALKQPLNVYDSPNREATVLKNYSYNHKLVFYPFSSDWYRATIYLKGIAYRGYIHKEDVGNNPNLSVRGVALTNTKIYSSPDSNTKVLKSYKKGSILKYRSYKEGWYIATVYVNGERETGYISSKDVETVHTEQQTLKGIGAKKPTKVYTLASTDSKILKSYKQGQILRYRSFTKNWYEATVYVNGGRKTGYIHSKDVELIKDSQQTLNGIAMEQPTRVYTYASKNSKALKDYKYGHILKFRTFSNRWYEATIYTNGIRQTGYISIDDINTNLNSVLKGYALSSSTRVYSDTSRKASVLKEYNKGHLLQYQSHNSNWFKARVYVGEEAKTGYIHTSDVSPNPLTLDAYALAKPTNVYNNKSKKSKILKSYKQGSLLKLRYHNSTWYEATVYIKGKPYKGYVHINDVGNSPPNNANQDVNPPVIEEEVPPVTEEPEFKIPILMYHQVGKDPKPENYGLFVSAENFREQINYLKSKGYTLINFDELSDIENITKPIIITFDDGYENNMAAYEILHELKDESFQPKATFFIISSKIDTNRYLSSDQVKEISDSGIVSIQSHTMTHPFFNDKETIDILNYTEELFESKSILEEITGKEISALAYPYGSYNDIVIEETKKYYDYAVTTRSGIASTNDSPYELPRVRVRYDTTIEQFEKSIGEK